MLSNQSSQEQVKTFVLKYLLTNLFKSYEHIWNFISFFFVRLFHSNVYSLCCWLVLSVYRSTINFFKRKNPCGVIEFAPLFHSLAETSFTLVWITVFFFGFISNLFSKTLENDETEKLLTGFEDSANHSHNNHVTIFLP